MQRPVFRFAMALAGICGRAATPTDGDVQHMAPYQVTNSPLGYMGIRVKIDLDSSGSDQAKIKSMIVSHVLAHSSAEQAGVRAEDRIVAIDGRPVTEMSIDDLKGLLGSKRNGDSISVEARSPRSSASKVFVLTFGQNEKK
jgi:C-terminal processing protease CtpA/Prc